MRVLVIADTHMPKKAKEWPGQLYPEFNAADYIIHAGDWQSPEVWEELKQYAPVAGVYGNVDGEDIKALMSDRVEIVLEGWRIGIVHGHGEKGTTEKRAGEAFAPGQKDIIIFGHSHIPYLRYAGKTLMFNPGSPTDKRKAAMFSYGLLDLSPGHVEARHIFFPKRG
ncbi:YfcE family phosphodiesterase [Marinococcus halophilus]|uniref:Phosphoesterase n=1 Tax=Marinococcus halophilus TaxID=1371 RepID=A0A510Y7Y2_MARHA|nr:metallophosphoesterase [Marinococcus halophilus]OZT80445.1 YfcE family phosphodiesterase [Marinococcus halophilus]GEK58517.1 phosphoesterase [Marinococcus halophilus]